MDREQLLKARIPEREVEVPGVGLIRVRGLSRAQVLHVRTLRDDQAAMEKAILKHCVVDPQLSDEDVAAWYEAAPAREVDPILDVINELSGLTEGASKSGVQGVRRGRGA